MVLLIYMIKKIVISIIILASLTLNGYFVVLKNREMTATSVHDGDTFTLGDGQRVKLIGVNAPELDKCGSLEAKDFLTTLVLNKTIKITNEKRDTYGRRMGLVWVGSILVNEELLKNGWARPDYTPNSESENLKKAYKEATDNKVGIHSLCKKVSPTPPNSKCVIKGNIDKSSWEHYYHLPNCRHYNQIVMDTDLGEQFFCSETEATEAGFHLAPDCLR